MKRTTLVENVTHVETFDLSKEQHDMVVEMVKSGKEKNGNYALEEVDADMLDVWIDNAKEEGNTEYENFLANAQLLDADVYTLTDNFGFSQPIGEVVVYD